MRILVLGAAVSGQAAVRLAEQIGHAVAVYDANAEALHDLAAAGMEVHAGEFDAALLDNVDLVVTSPGIPEWAPPIQATLEAGVRLVSELEFASRFFTGPYAAVTGTNGKTTTTEATAEMLQESGIDAIAAGNVGTALSDVVLDGHEMLVIEASSFQLRFLEDFRPSAAAILNIAPDHLDWHGDFESYADAKARIGDNQDEDDLVVHDADDVAARRAAEQSRARRIEVSGKRRPDGGNGPGDGLLHLGDHSLAKPDLDPAFLLDLTAAATMALHLGASIEAVGAVITRFEPGEHRRTTVGIWHDVRWVNDSKATNPHAAASSIEAYDSVVLIAGGRNKDLDLAPMFTPDRPRHVIAIGEATAEISTLVATERLTAAATMDEAIERAADIARAGDTVLLAPGCTSFDMFANYGERGRHFTSAVRRIVGGADERT